MFDRGDTKKRKISRVVTAEEQSQRDKEKVEWKNKEKNNSDYILVNEVVENFKGEKLLQLYEKKYSNEEFIKEVNDFV
jgi:hypothetical protein